MSEIDEKDPPLSEFKHNLDEVIELLNKPYTPIIVSEESKPEAVAPAEAGSDDSSQSPEEAAK